MAPSRLAAAEAPEDDMSRVWSALTIADRNRKELLRTLVETSASPATKREVKPGRSHRAMTE